MALYAILATPPLLVSARPPGWWAWLLLHAVIVLLGWPPSSLRRGLAAVAARGRLVGLLLDWYPILLVPVLYTELGVLIAALHGGRFHDQLIQHIEQLVFGFQPSHVLAQRYPIRWLSELLHAGYLSYYAIIYVPAISHYFGGRRDAALKTIFAVMLTFVLHCLVFIYFPVQGPRYLFTTPVAAAAAGPVYRLVHVVLQASSQGAAFPSSHVGVACVQVVTMMRYNRRAALGLGVLAVLLAAGAVYGGYHYAIDAVGGLLLGVTAGLAAPAAYRAMGGDWPKASARP
ncbi:MAG: hypothetical protein FIB01_02165 [Gemmatimonadetes bacterium]|nr:hypothetical protein [Gemmatimonadota bacterium]